MEAVDVLGRINSCNNLLCIYLFRQWQLYEDTVHLLVRVERRDERDQFGFASAGRQSVVKGPHAGLCDRLGFGADVDLARRIVANENDSNPRHDAAIATQPMHGIRDPAA